MFILKSIIYSFFGIRDVINDPFKDDDEKGLNQRFMEYIADGMDDNELSDVNNLVSNTQDFENLQTKWIPYHKAQRGHTTELSTDPDIQLKILRWWFRIVNLKGTKRGYAILLRLQGFTGWTFIETVPKFGFDQGNGFDSKTFDNSKPSVSFYELQLTGSGSLTQEQEYRVFRAIEIMEPINAELTKVLYNGDLMVEIVVTVTVDEFGDLIYDNTYDPELVLTIDELGDLIISGPNAQYYYINDDGDLIYTIL